MRRTVISLAAVAVIVLVPVAVYLLRSDAHGRSLRATIGRCSAAQRVAERAACSYLDSHPALVLDGPIDETGTPFATVLERAGPDRRIEARLDSGRYAVLLAVEHGGTVRASVTSDVDLSSGDRDLGTIVPARPWQFAAMPGS